MDVCDPKSKLLQDTLHTYQTWLQSSSVLYYVYLVKSRSGLRIGHAHGILSFALLEHLVPHEFIFHTNSHATRTGLSS